MPDDNIDISALLDEVRYGNASQEPVFSQNSTSFYESEASYIHLRGLERHYKLKTIWAYAVMAIMAGMLAFQCFLLWMVGANDWSFVAYKWLLPALLVQNLAQVSGLAYIVVKALFNNNPIGSVK